VKSAAAWIGFGVLLLSVVTAGNVGAQQYETGGKSAVRGIRGELLRQLDEARSKMLDLAGAIPQAKYTWRPGKGVRSVAEVYLHVAAANYNLPRLINISPPAGVVPAKLEKSTTARSQVLDRLKESFAHAEKAIRKTKDADLDKPAKIFGRQGTVREVLLLMVTHAHEHLGQSIAYARVNGVVPPWTAREEAREAKSKK